MAPWAADRVGQLPVPSQAEGVLAIPPPPVPAVPPPGAIAADAGVASTGSLVSGATGSPWAKRPAGKGKEELPKPSWLRKLALGSNTSRGTLRLREAAAGDLPSPPATPPADHHPPTATRQGTAVEEGDRLLMARPQDTLALRSVTSQRRLHRQPVAPIQSLRALVLGWSIAVRWRCRRFLPTPVSLIRRGGWRGLVEIVLRRTGRPSIRLRGC